jgi:hypothetical protein
MQPIERFLGQMSPDRLMWIIVLAACLGGSVAADLCSDWWDASPFTTNVISSVLLVALTVLLVDEYLTFRAAEAWEAVAAFGLEDLGRVARAVWVRHASFIQPELAAMPVAQYRQQFRSAEGRRQQADRMRQIAGYTDRRHHLYEVLHETTERTRDLLIRWAPTMVSRAPLAGHLSDFSRMHRQMVQVLSFLHISQHQAMPITVEELAQKVLAINMLAEELDRRFFAEAEQTDPLYPSPSS